RPLLPGGTCEPAEERLLAGHPAAAQGRSGGPLEVLPVDGTGPGRVRRHAYGDPRPGELLRAALAGASPGDRVPPRRVGAGRPAPGSVFAGASAVRTAPAAVRIASRRTAR